MKKILIIIFLSLLKIANAQFHNCAGNETFALQSTIVSHETPNQNGTLKYTMKLKATDSIWIDSLKANYTYFSAYSYNNTLPLLLKGGDSILIEITTTYDSLSLPFYYKTINNFVHTHTPNGNKAEILMACNAYFTPYGTTELWSIDDFYKLPRIWAIQDSIEPTRVFIAKDSIAISTKEALDSTNALWEWDYQLAEMPNLPYAIQMKAIHPDTLAQYLYQDSTDNDSIVNPNYISSFSVTIGKKFKGRVRGRLMSDYLNDKDNWVQIPLAGVNCKLKSKGINVTLHEGHTDDNGYFDLDYSVVSFFDGQQIELFVEFKTENKRFDIKVNANKKDIFSITNALPPQGKNAEVQMGDILLNDEECIPYRNLNWVFLAYRFFENVAPSYKPNSGISVLLNKPLSDSYFDNDKTIYLSQRGRNFEDVTWHEFGHFVMYKIYERNLSNYNGAEHTPFRISNSVTAWKEGWANGFSNFLDLYYKQRDGGEFAFSKFVISNFEKRDRETVNKGNQVNGILSEYMIACTLYDLFDAESLFETGSSPSNFNDASRSSTAYDLKNLGYDPGLEDDVNLNINTILEALNGYPNYTGSKSVAEYFENLMYIFRNNCAMKKKIKKIFTQNDVKTKSNNPDPNATLSSDEIGRIQTISEINAVNATFYTSYLLDREDIKVGLDQTYNMIGAAPYSSNSQSYKTLSDNLLIGDAGGLTFNDNNNSGWDVVNNTNPYPINNTTLNVNVCSDIVDVTNNGTLEIGDEQGTIKANVTVNYNSILALSATSINLPSTIIVNNNSTLVIEEGAILKYYPGAKIILNGPNAVLEIRGQIQVMDGATFTVEGGAQGLGVVKFFRNNGGSPLLITSPTNNGSVLLNGVNNTTKHVVIDGTDGLYLQDDILDFTMTNAKVQLGNNSRIEPRVKNNLYMENVNVEQLSTNFKHRGIYVCGLANKFLNVNIKGGVYGFRNFSDGARFNRLNLENVNIDECNYGIYSIKEGLNYTGGEVKGYMVSGWRALALSTNSILNGVTFKNTFFPNSDFPKGIDIVSDMFARVNLSFCNVMDNGKGLVAENTNIHLTKCNSINNNKMYGVWATGYSNLNIGSNPITGPSYTAFKKNQYHFMISNRGFLYMNEGRNGFYDQASTINTPRYIFSALLQQNAQRGVDYTVNPPVFPITENYFEEPTLVNQNNVGTNYILSETNGTTYSITRPTFYTTLQLWKNAFQSACGYAPPFIVQRDPNHKPTDGIFDVVKYGTIGGVILNCGTNANAPVVAVCKTLTDSLYLAVNPNYPTIVNGLIDIVNCTYSINTPIMQHFLYETYHHLIAAYSKGVSVGQIAVSDSTKSTLTLNVLNAIDNLKTKANNEILPWHTFKYQVHFSKAEVLRLAAHRNEAITTLNTDLNIFADSLQKIYLNKYKCINNAEIAFLNGTVSIDSIYIAFPCFDSKFNNQTNGYTLGSNMQNNAKINNSISLYPNPTNSALNIKANNEQTILKIMVYDIRGMVQKTMLYNANITELKLNLEDIAVGNYIIQVVTNQGVFNKPIIINR